MNKRIVDIYIPTKNDKKAIEIPPSEKVFEPSPKKVKKEKKKISFSLLNKKKLFWGVGMIIFFLAVLFLFSLSKAEVTYWPETEEVKVTTTLTIDVSADDINITDRIIPGELLKKEKTVIENFVATGKATSEGKAKGKITVYNEYSTDSQILVATTRFISTDGKLFRTPSRTVIPGGHKEGGNFIAGEKEIEVIADETGPEYNIEATTFSIPGFAGTARYTKFYAKSFQPMVGGFLSGSSLITAEDIENAKDIVTDRAEKEVKQLLSLGLEEEEMEKYISIDKAISIEIEEEFPLAVAGQEADNFNYKAVAIGQALVFAKSDLDSFINQFLLTKVEDGNKIYEPSLEVSYVQESINLNTGKIILSLSLSAKSYKEIDVNNLRRLVSGKSLTGSKIIVENQIGVTKVEVDFWPFWVKKAPQGGDKIKMEMKID
ncbi:MAG: hypothetical protein ABID67_02540 [Candidatus Nealsonbacteria bacterium]